MCRLSIFVFCSIFLLGKSRNVYDGNTTLPSSRTPIGLTGKQGFILNQMLGAYAIENPSNILCKNHTKDFKMGVRAFKPWALRMLDASSKLQSGLLLGNLVEYGSYSECLKVFSRSEYGPLWGKHCMLRILPSDKLLFQILKLNNLEGKRRFVNKDMFRVGWSICVPHSCPADDILYHFNRTIRDLSVGIDLEVTLDENNCHSILDYPVLDTTQTIILLACGMFILASFVVSVIDINSKTGNLSQMVKTFSAYGNMKKLCSVDGEGKFDFFYGLRFISSSFVIMGHRFIMYIIYPVINGLEELEWPSNYSSLIILGSTVSVDSFFLISAMFVSLGFFQHVNKTGHFNIVAFYLYRYLRITLPLMLVVIFYIYLAQFFVHGPYTYDNYLAFQKPCQNFWWSTILHLQTIINPGHLCIFQIWYLSCEMPFFFFSPLILYPLWKWPKMGYVILVICYIIFITISFYLAWVKKLDGSPLPVSNQLLSMDFFKYFYVAPHVRAPPYIMGLAFGYFIYRTSEKKVTLGRGSKYIGWITSFVLLIVSTGGCRTFYLDNHQFNHMESASYLAFARSSWSVGLMWIIWCCINGCGGVLNKFLSAKIFKILGRVTYGMFLIHSIIQVSKGGSSKVASNFSNFNAFYDGAADITLSLILSFLFTVFFEMPLAQIQALYLAKN